MNSGPSPIILSSHTAVSVAGLFREGFLVEVEAVAVVPE